MILKIFWLIIPLIIITSYIIIFGWKLPFYKEQFANPMYISNSELLATSNMYISDSNLLLTSNYINLGQYYNNIISASNMYSMENSNINFDQYMIGIGLYPNSNISKDPDILAKYYNIYLNSSNYYLYTPEQIKFNPSLYEQSVNMALQSISYNDRKSIDDPITDAYLPYSCNIFNDGNRSPETVNIEYTIISIFKDILGRNPTSSELTKYTEQIGSKELDEHLLKTQLFNSAEYRRNIKLQSNEISADISYSIAKEDMLSYVGKLYFDELDKEAPRVMLLPLRDIYMYLQSNEYLFRAFLIHQNYKLFEKEVSETRLLTKSLLAEIFSRYFLLYDLKLVANDIKKSDILKRSMPLQPASSMCDTSSVAPSVTPSTTQATPIIMTNTNQDSSQMYTNIVMDANKVFDINDVKHYLKMK